MMRFRSAAALTAIILLHAVPAAYAQDTTRALTLGDAVRLAAQQSAGALAARYHSEEMDARARSSHAALLPSADFAWGDNKRTYNSASFGIPFPGFSPNGSIIGPVRAIDLRARASALLWNPAGMSEFRNAEAAASRADADAASTTENVMAVAAAAYIRATRADAQVSARAADSSLAQDLLDIAQSELRAGVGVALDVTRTQVQLAKIRAQLSAARNERDRARLELLRAAGLPLTTVIVLRDSLAVVPPDSPDVPVTAAIAQAMQARADLRAVTSAVAATDAAVQAARSEWHPSVGLYGDNGFTSAAYPYLQRTYTYGVQISLPIFEGWRRESRIDERDAVLRGAELRKRDLEVQISVDVRGALLDLSSAREQVGASRDGLQFAEQAVTQARDRFSTGVAGSADVISAQLDVSTARSLLVDALTALQTARIALARAQGRLAILP